jgi:hypothetical protein
MLKEHVVSHMLRFHGVKFVAHFCPTNSRVGKAAALIDVDSSPRLFSSAGYFQVIGRCFDGYGL